MDFRGPETITEADLAAHVQLSKLEYSGQPVADERHLRWKFLCNPDGPARAVCAWQDGQLVGRIVAMPRRFRSGSRQVTGGFLVDMLVAPSVRGAGVLFGLVQRMLADPAFAFLFVTPNANGIPVWRDLARFRQIGELDAWVIPLRPFSATARSDGWAVRCADALTACAVSLPIQSTGPSIQGVPHGPVADPPGRADGPLLGCRRQDFLDWRTGCSPVIRYERTTLTDEDGAPSMIVTRHAEVFGLRVTLLIDLLPAGRLPTSLAHAVDREIIASANRNCSHFALCLVSSGMRMTHLRQPVWWKIPRRMQPQPMPVLARWRDRDHPPDPLNLSLADLDMF